MKFFKSLKIFLIAILIIGIATPISTEAATIKSGNLMNINKTVSNNAITKGETTDVTLTVKGTPQDSTFVKPNDVILIVDKSGSMQADNRIGAAKEAAKEFIDLMDLTKHEVGIVDYSTNAASFPLTTDKDDAKAYVDTIQLGGSTNTSAAIRQATAMLANHRADAQPTIVIMTDGEANNTADAIAAAKEAKDAGITFYTIALLSPNEDADANPYNQLLKEMASSFDHHHFVLGSVGLSDVYRQIVEEIGLASAYNVTITDTISPEFEIVPGSYDHHIPKPTVTGNTIEWSISELKTNELSFTYQVRAKDDATAGKYTVAQTSTTFETGDGTTYSLDSTNPIVEIKNHAPIITSITEDKGLTTGGETVTITGQNFLPNAKVFFGAKLATIVSETETEIVVTTPTGTQGIAVVKVENTDKQFAVGDFNYYADPTITSITPAEGPLEGGNKVFVSGSSFLKGATVYINDVAATTDVVSAARLDVIIPAATEAGTVTVKVVNPDNTSVELVDGYTYLAPPPAPMIELISLSVTSGETKGGGIIDLTGKNFDRNVKVYFGDVETKVTFITASRVRVSAPATTTPGLVSVKAENPDGTFAELVDAYTYLAPPPPPMIELTSLSLTSGETKGGESLTLIGKNFNRNVKVYFGDAEPTVTFISSSQIRIITPATATTGFVSVKAENPDGTSAELVDAYEYLTPALGAAPEITSISEDSVLTGQTKTILLYGKNLNGNSKVFIGDQEATVTFLAATRVRVVVPISIVAETVDVKVVNADNQSDVLANAFTYIEPIPDPAPIITSLDIASGSMAGGETIIITGENFKRGAKVFFGNTAGIILSVNATEIKVKTPASLTTDLVSVTVVNTDLLEDTLVDAYKYEGKKAILTSLSQDSGASKGGYDIILYGSNFDKNMTVTVGGTPTTFVSLAATRIRVRIPAGSPGMVDITVTIGDQSTSIPFTYN